MLQELSKLIDLVTAKYGKEAILSFADDGEKHAYIRNYFTGEGKVFDNLEHFLKELNAFDNT